MNDHERLLAFFESVAPAVSGGRMPTNQSVARQTPGSNFGSAGLEIYTA